MKGRDKYIESIDSGEPTALAVGELPLSTQNKVVCVTLSVVLRPRGNCGYIQTIHVLTPSLQYLYVFGEKELNNSFDISCYFIPEILALILTGVFALLW